MTDPTPISEAADRLAAAYTDGPCAPIRDLLPQGDVAAAYAVQDMNTKRWLAEGRRLVGRKTGLTARSVQRQLGVDQPDYGMLFADMSLGDGEEIAKGRLLQPKVEGEIAFIIGRDLTAPDTTAGEVLRAIDSAVAAIEIVDSRVAGWDIRITDTIADNASSGLFALGTTPVSLSKLDLWACGMVLEARGEPVSTGAGVACLGNPVNAVTWLAQVMARAGRPLVAGDVVLAGALGPMVAAKPGDSYELRISGLGAVRVAFAA
ncbi:MAG: fumarylacetoacetate hydrolase family protein [Zavarzinia sp.]|nr:fumarylacetoacetate hydrolase family protein [Zavarzinia sp.]